MMKYTKKTAILTLSISLVTAPVCAWDEASEEQNQEQELRAYFEQELAAKQQQIEHLQNLVNSLEQEKTDLEQYCVTRNRDAETAEAQMQAVTDDIATIKAELEEAVKKAESLKKQLDQAKINLKKADRLHAQLTQDLQDVQQKAFISIPVSALAGLIAGHYLSKYVCK